MKKITYLILLGCLVLSGNLFGQDPSKDVTIITSGSGTTEEKATQNALRSAIEQAFGTFISAKTEILNDELISDEITSVASGNIKSYDVLNASQLPNGTWGVTLKSVVSVDKLTSFVQAKGVEVEIKGGLFALNIKQQLLNEQGEIKAVSEMVGLLHEPMQTSFDYVMKTGEPQSLDTESKNWEILLEVTATANKNMEFCANYCIKTLSALSLTAEEVTSYKSLNKDVFPVVIKMNGVAKTFYLRKQSSILTLATLSRNWDFYTRLFTVQSGMDELNGFSFPYYTNSEHRFCSIDGDSYAKGKSITFNFLTTGQQAITFVHQDKRTLSQIEQMTGYEVKPRGVVSQFKHGGFVIFEENGHGLVIAISDVGFRMDWQSAKTACEALISNGYSDWRLPSHEELNLVYANWKQFEVYGLYGLYGGAYEEVFGSYWSSTQDMRAVLYKRNPSNPSEPLWERDSYNSCNVRAVRTF